MGFGIDWNRADQAIPAEVRVEAEARLARLWQALSALRAGGGRSSTAFRMTVAGWSLLYTIDFAESLILIEDAYTGVRAAIKSLRAAHAA